jgi:hypothetical protein
VRLVVGPLLRRVGFDRLLIGSALVSRGQPLTLARFHAVFLLSAILPLLAIPGFLRLRGWRPGERPSSRRARPQRPGGALTDCRVGCGTAAKLRPLPE